jgi:sarcosine oxidase/L-pipecolate oxidase
LHGLNQSADAIKEIVDNFSPTCILVQEHWQIEDNLCKLDILDDYFVISSSAMRARTELGPLIGRPSGGLAIYVSKSQISNCHVISTADRFIVISIGEIIVINVYMPCAGSDDRLNVFNAVLSDVSFWIEQHIDSPILMGGDFNVDIQSAPDSKLSRDLAQFCQSFNLKSSYQLYPNCKFSTFCQESNNSFSLLDYFFVSSSISLSDVFVYEPAVSFSDHFPVICELSSVSFNAKFSGTTNHIKHNAVPHLRWDHADLSSYYAASRVALEPIFDEIKMYDECYQALSHEVIACLVDSFVARVSSALLATSTATIPCVKKNFFKYWWDHDLSRLKFDCVESSKAWNAASKPRTGPIFQRRNSARLLYRKRLRQAKELSNRQSCGFLSDALIDKNGPAFWRAWKANFCNSAFQLAVDNNVDDNVIADNFAKFFKEISNPTVNSRELELHQEFVTLREGVSDYFAITQCFDNEVLGSCIARLQRATAPGPDNLTSEHLVFCHPVLVSILSRIFNFIIASAYVPLSFCSSFTVPIPKGVISSTVTTVNAFRGISVSSVLAKLLESCILEIFSVHFDSSDAQFGFKLGLGCTNAIFTVKCLVGDIIKGGDTACIAALDVAKAFPSVNHDVVLSKLLARGTPAALVDLLDNWIRKATSKVKWRTSISDSFGMRIGLNQGSVLAPALFAIVIDDILTRANRRCIGLIIAYADDIIIVSRSVFNLQVLFCHLEHDLNLINLYLNVDKCACIRIGPRHSKLCAPICSLVGSSVPSVSELRYLGVYLLSGDVFRTSVQYQKKKFCRAVNAIFSKTLGLANEDVVVYLLKVKCLPILLYASEVCSLRKSIVSSLDFLVIRFGMKLFKSNNRDLVVTSFSFMGLELPSLLVLKRWRTFQSRSISVSNLIFRRICSSSLT